MIILSQKRSDLHAYVLFFFLLKDYGSFFIDNPEQRRVYGAWKRKNKKEKKKSLGRNAVVKIISGILYFHTCKSIYDKYKHMNLWI